MYKTAIAVVLGGACVITWLYWGQTRSSPVVVTGFLEADEIRVGSRVGGRVAEVMVSEGQTVEPGTPLLRTDPFDIQQQLAAARAELAALEADRDRFKAGFRQQEIEQLRSKRNRSAEILAKLRNGARPAEIEIARSRIKIVKAQLELAQTEHGRISKLFETSQASEVEMSMAVCELKKAQAQAETAELELKLLQEGARKEDISEAEAALAEANAALKLVEQGYRVEDIAKAAAQVNAAKAKAEAIEVRLKELTIVSPCSCEVETVSLRPGDLITANAPTVALLDLSRLWVRAYVPEILLGRLKLGASIPVTFESFPGQQFIGRISFVGHQAEFTPRNIQTPEERGLQVFRIKVTLEEGLDRLRVGMAADVHLDEITDTRENSYQTPAARAN